LCFGDALARPAPAKEISTTSSGPKLWEIHTAKIRS
jgi:hypothetical protein